MSSRCQGSRTEQQPIGNALACRRPLCALGDCEASTVPTPAEATTTRGNEFVTERVGSGWPWTPDCRSCTVQSCGGQLSTYHHAQYRLQGARRAPPQSLTSRGTQCKNSQCSRSTSARQQQQQPQRFRTPGTRVWTEYHCLFFVLFAVVVFSSRPSSPPAIDELCWAAHEEEKENQTIDSLKNARWTPPQSPWR